MEMYKVTIQGNHGAARGWTTYNKANSCIVSRDPLNSTFPGRINENHNWRMMENLKNRNIHLKAGLIIF